MSNYRHGGARTKLYRVWRAMISRCTDPNVKAFPDYGGRGIFVCEKWRSFAAFHDDMGDCPSGMTLDREDNDLGYSPDNCRWVDRKTQARNKRGLRLITVDGETKSLGEWAEVSGLSVGTLWARLNYGWTAEAAVRTPKVANRRTPIGAKHGVRWSDPIERQAA